MAIPPFFFRKATENDLPQLAKLFDNYRVFYKQENDRVILSPRIG